MSILFHIFVVLYSQYLLMENIKNIASPVSSISVVSTQVPMNKAAGDAPLLTTMKMIEDLGMQYPTSKSKTKKHYALYECPLCKKIFKTCTYAVNRGDTRACGCSSFGIPRHRMWRSSIYKVWSMMKSRCANTNNPSYKNYGARGISVYPPWINDFIIFYEWAIENGYKDNSKMELNRKDNDKDYSPMNCEFTTHSINNQNTRLLQKNNTTGYRGVYYSKNKKDVKKWMAGIRSNKKCYYLGYFATPEQAAQSYNNFIIKNKTYHPLNKI